MAKHTTPKKLQPMADFDFSNFMIDDTPADEAVVGMMSGFIEAHHHHQQAALELTKLVIENNGAESMSEEAIFSTFKRAAQLLREISPIKELWEKMSDQ